MENIDSKHGNKISVVVVFQDRNVAQRGFPKYSFPECSTFLHQNLPEFQKSQIPVSSKFGVKVRFNPNG